MLVFKRKSEERVTNGLISEQQMAQLSTTIDPNPKHALRINFES
jgi:hypothetical protein